MSRLCRFFVLLIAAYTVVGCTPVGSIGGSGALDFLLVEPLPAGGYKVGDTFKPSVNLQVSVPSPGGLRPVSLSQVSISLSEPPNKNGELKAISLDTAITLKEGTYVFVVDYLALTGSCYINVGTSTGGNGSNSFINIEWVD